MPNEIVNNDDIARLNVTYAGANGDLPDPIHISASDDDVRRVVAEAIRTGSIPGIPASHNVNLMDFVVERFNARDGLPARVVVRPKTPFGI